MRSNLLAGAVGAVVAVAAIGLGVGAIGFVRAEVSDSGTSVLTSDAVAALADAASGTASPTQASPSADAPSPTDTPSPTASASVSAPAAGPVAGGTAVLTSSGGSAVVRCDGDRVELVSWAPAPGFAADDSIARGPDRELEIEFRSSDTKAQITASCSDGAATSRVEVRSDDTPDRGPDDDDDDDDGQGGGDGGDGGGSGRGGDGGGSGGGQGGNSGGGSDDDQGGDD